MNNKTRLSRLRRLRDVVQLHREAKGEQVKLNGTCRKFNMEDWDCGTSACALGSYALTPYGKRHLVLDTHDTPRLKNDFDTIGYDAAKFHFGITLNESTWIFSPFEYKSDPIPANNVLRRIDSLIRRYEND